MDVKDRIKKVEKYFKGMQVQNLDGANIIYIIVQFPPRWIIDNEIPNKYGVSVGQGNDYEGQFFFCAEMEKGFDVVFDAIEYNVNKMLTAQERAKLFREKTQELQNLFEDETISIESLRNLEFTYKTTKNRKKIEKKTTQPKIEESVLEQEIDTNNEELEDEVNE